MYAHHISQSPVCVSVRPSLITPSVQGRRAYVDFYVKWKVLPVDPYCWISLKTRPVDFNIYLKGGVTVHGTQDLFSYQIVLPDWRLDNCTIELPSINLSSAFF